MNLAHINWYNIHSKHLYFKKKMSLLLVLFSSYMPWKSFFFKKKYKIFCWFKKTATSSGFEMFKENTLNVDQVLKEENDTKAGNKLSKMAV